MGHQPARAVGLQPARRERHLELADGEREADPLGAVVCKQRLDQAVPELELVEHLGDAEEQREVEAELAEGVEVELRRLRRPAREAAEHLLRHLPRDGLDVLDVGVVVHPDVEADVERALGEGVVRDGGAGERRVRDDDGVAEHRAERRRAPVDVGDGALVVRPHPDVVAGADLAGGDEVEPGEHVRERVLERERDGEAAHAERREQRRHRDVELVEHEEHADDVDPEPDERRDERRRRDERPLAPGVRRHQPRRHARPDHDQAPQHEHRDDVLEHHHHARRRRRRERGEVEPGDGAPEERDALERCHDHVVVRPPRRGREPAEPVQHEPLDEHAREHARGHERERDGEVFERRHLHARKLRHRRPILPSALSRTRMERKTISSGAPWEPVVGYARAVRVGPFVYVTGTAAVDDSGKVVAPGDVAAQTEFVLRKIERALADLGASLADVVRTRIYVTDIAQWEAVGRVHGRFFGEILPATTMVEVAALIDPAMLVEIEADAIVQG